MQNASLLRRGEIDLRSLIQGLEMPSSTLMADGTVFAQLIQPARPVSDEGSGLGGGSAAMAAKPDAVGAQLIEELAQRLPLAPPGAFTATLLMPNLGKVQVRAGKREGHWDVELGFTRRETFERLHGQRCACEAALAVALGSPVQLALLDEARP
ncbi:type III secretion system HrpP C-terminal domain-containing protein [Phytopseudomonas flavescens]|uniref:type III secretion system HrpP C-terminal domain-containing protein n=1 Tax=Phytopseudomonas flavescens TaxID=29435 RepID=UPI001FC9E4AE|nr:type III secretion system HrpP C-terminal domain-containing protein [Pseudomonas flavescens]